MVGMVIGMLGLVIMMQVFTLSEGQKRTTTGGGDAQSSGAIALYGLQRDLQQSGFGIADLTLAGCNLTLRAGVVLSNLGPVTINHPNISGQDANTDTLLLIYGNSNGTPQGDRVTAQPTAPGFAVPDIYATGTPSSFTAGDLIIATPQNRATPQCDLALARVVAVGQIATGNAANVVVTAGTGVDLGKVGGAGVVCTVGVCGAFAGGQGVVFNLGQAPKIAAYAIRGGNLTQCDYMINNCGNAASNNDSTIWLPIASNIASLKAQYGRDTMFGLNPLNTTIDGIVDRYDNATPPSIPPAVPVAPKLNYACDWMKISAVRIALVARNGNFEKTDNTTVPATYVSMTQPLWEASAAYTAPNPPTATDYVSWAASPIVLTNAGLTAPATWQNYRYKVLQTVVPLRNLNLAWQGVTCTS
jgi:type IV pilus assembly protein PilW